MAVSEAGREYNTVDMSRIKMYQYYLPPYKAAIDAGVGIRHEFLQ